MQEIKSSDNLQFPRWSDVVKKKMELRKFIITAFVGLLIFSSGYLGGMLTKESIRDPVIQTVVVPAEIEIEVTDLDRLLILQEETKQYWVDQEINVLEIDSTGFVSAFIEREFIFTMRLEIANMTKIHLGGNYLILSGSEEWSFSEFVESIPITLFDFTEYALDFQRESTAILFGDDSVRILYNEHEEDYYFKYDSTNGVLQSFSLYFYENNSFGLTIISIDFESVEEMF